MGTLVSLSAFASVVHSAVVNRRTNMIGPQQGALITVLSLSCLIVSGRSGAMCLINVQGSPALGNFYIVTDGGWQVSRMTYDY